MAYVDPLHKFKVKDSEDIYNKVYFVNDYLVVVMPQSVYIASAIETSSFSQQDVSALEGTYLPLDAWANLVKAEVIELGDFAHAELPAMVQYADYRSEIFFQKSSPEVMQHLSDIFKGFLLLEEAQPRRALSLGCTELHAFLSLKPADTVYVQSLREHENVMIIADVAGKRFLYHAPFYDQPLLLLDMFKVAAMAMSQAHNSSEAADLRMTMESLRLQEAESKEPGKDDQKGLF